MRSLVDTCHDLVFGKDMRLNVTVIPYMSSNGVYVFSSFVHCLVCVSLFSESLGISPDLGIPRMVQNVMRYHDISPSVRGVRPSTSVRDVRLCWPTPAYLMLHLSDLTRTYCPSPSLGLNLLNSSPTLGLNSLKTFPTLRLYPIKIFVAQRLLSQPHTRTPPEEDIERECRYRNTNALRAC